MSKVKPYKEQDAPAQLANEPMMAYNMQESVTQKGEHIKTFCYRSIVWCNSFIC